MAGKQPPPDQQEFKLLRASYAAGMSYRNAVRRLQQAEGAWRKFAMDHDPGDATHDDHHIRMRSLRAAHTAAEDALVSAQDALARFYGQTVPPTRKPSKRRVIAGLRRRIATIESGASA